MSLLSRAFGPRGERRAAWDSTALSPKPWNLASGGALASSGLGVDMQSALSMMTFFRGVQLIADSVSLLPLNAVEQRPDGTRRPVVDKPKILTDPFMGFSLSEGLSQLVTSLLLRGNGYPYVVAYDEGAMPETVQLLSPDQVRVSWDPVHGGRAYSVGTSTLNPSNMSHLTNFMLPGSITGAGVIEYCRNALGLGLALDDVAGRFFKNGIMSTGIISVDAELTPDNARATADQFVQNHSGSSKAHLPIVIGGGAKYTPISLTPDDAQFIQSRQFQQGEIATLLGIPPHLLGIVDRTTSWGTGIEVQGRAYVDYTLRPFIERLQRMFTDWLPDGMFAEFNTDALTRPESLTRFQGYAAAVQAGLLNVDEIRAREGLPALPNGAGQTYFMSTLAQAVSNPDGSLVQAPPAAVPTDDPSTDTQGGGVAGDNDTTN